LALPGKGGNSAKIILHCKILFAAKILHIAHPGKIMLIYKDVTATVGMARFLLNIGMKIKFTIVLQTALLGD
jgi:hypothetical protein